MGFTDKARDIFSLEGQIASYMHLVISKIKLILILCPNQIVFLLEIATGGSKTRYSIRSAASHRIEGEGSFSTLLISGFTRSTK